MTFGLHNSEVNFTLEKTSKLCNPKINHTSEKKLPNYVIRKLIMNLKMTFGLRNPKYYIRIFLEIQKLMEVRRNSPSRNGQMKQKRAQTQI